LVWSESSIDGSVSLLLLIVNALDLLYIPIVLISAPIWMRKKREGWNQRFGHIESMFKSSGSDSSINRVMLHAVSVGEVNALRSLVPDLASQANVIVATTTDTGLKQAQSLFGKLDRCEVVRYPLDCSWMVKRFLDVIKPDVVGLVELEVWPNFIKACTKRDIPIGIINGRLSARSFKGYRKLRALLSPTFRRLAFACVQDQDYADRIGAMGVAKERIAITGSMKWDSVDASVHTEPSARVIEIGDAMGIDRSKPVVVAGSTGPGEEAMLHKALPGDIQLVLAPRKTERFNEAGEAVTGCVRRSAGECKPGSTRFMLDTIGELSSVYELADIVIIGRSFFDLYGSDPVEPAAMGKAVLIGPANSDFQHAMEALISADAIQVVDRQMVGEAVKSLLDDARLREEMGKRARACVIAQQGASKKHLQVLLDSCIGA